MLILTTEQKKTDDGIDVNVYLLNKSTHTIHVISSDSGGESPIEINVKSDDGKKIEIIVIQYRTYAPGYKQKPPQESELLAGNKIILCGLSIKKAKFLTGSYGVTGRIMPGVFGFSVENYVNKPLSVSFSYEKWIDKLNNLNSHIKNHDFKNDQLIVKDIRLDIFSKSKEDEKD